MRRVARLARPLRNALTTGRVGSVAAVAVASSDMTTVMGPAVATRTAVEMAAVDTEEVSRAALVPRTHCSCFCSYKAIVFGLDLSHMTKLIFSAD